MIAVQSDRLIERRHEGRAAFATQGDVPRFWGMQKSRKSWSTLTALALGAGALAFGNVLAARRAERKHPPEGSFIEVDGVKLHYRDRGHGPPVVLIHGNAVTGADWRTSGVEDMLLPHHRVIVFDRPGFGYSERPRDRIWTAGQQAELLFRALQQLGIERPVVVGHSWGGIVALSMAVLHERDLAGVVLVSGYYFWTVRPDVLPVIIGAIPGLGDLLAYTVSPLLGRLQMPLLKWQMFYPRRRPERFRHDYSNGMALRPSQIRATSEDGALMIPGALAYRGRYEKLRLPVDIIAGERDIVVFKDRAERLADTIPGSILHMVPEAGHMVHYTAGSLVAAAVKSMAVYPRERLRAAE